MLERILRLLEEGEEWDLMTGLLLSMSSARPSWKMGFAKETRRIWGGEKEVLEWELHPAQLAEVRGDKNFQFEIEALECHRECLSQGQAVRIPKGISVHNPEDAAPAFAVSQAAEQSWWCSVSKENPSQIKSVSAGPSQPQTSFVTLLTMQTSNSTYLEQSQFLMPPNSMEYLVGRGQGIILLAPFDASLQDAGGGGG